MTKGTGWARGLARTFGLDEETGAKAARAIEMGYQQGRIDEARVWRDRLTDRIARLDSGAERVLAPVAIEVLMDPEHLAKRFHETYEALALRYGMRDGSAPPNPWAEVSEAGRKLTIEVCRHVISELVQRHLESSDSGG